MDSKFALLKCKDIITILDGDIELEKSKKSELDEYQIPIQMPYLSGVEICQISQRFGLPQEYPKLSRWQYFENLMDYAIKKNKMSLLLEYLFSKENFRERLERCRSREEVDEKHKYIVENAINHINRILYFGGHELIRANNNFIIKEINEKVEISIAKIKIINREYIKNLSERALQDVEAGNLDSAITKARTILEETFCYVIESKQETPTSSGNIHTLYKEVKELYNMHIDKDMDNRIKKMLSGLENIVQAVSEMRNNGSDSHGLGNRRINIAPYHARLVVNSATIMADFIISVAQANKGVNNL